MIKTDQSKRTNLVEAMIAHADRMLFEAELTGFYGELTFCFKAGKIVLVRRSETLVPSSNGNGRPDPAEEHTENIRGSYERVGTENR